MAHRHRYGQKWHWASGKIRCKKCGERMPWEEVERRINATECFSATDAEYARKHHEVCGLWLDTALMNYAKILGKK